MKNKPTQTDAYRYRQDFWRQAIRSLPYQYGLALSTKLRSTSVTKKLERRRDVELNKAELKIYSISDQNTYQQTIATTLLWHGSGRLQHEKSHIKDVFTSILKTGSLNPLRDDYALLLGGSSMHTISTTPLRLIGRSYADIHGRGKFEPNRYGSSLLWISYFYGRFFAETVTRHGITMARNRSRFFTAIKDNSGTTPWGKKVHTQAEYVWDVFSSGSDIPNNYPILFGIARYGATAQLPGVFGRKELRLTEAIKISDLSHIEVPEAKIEEIQLLLSEHGYSVPVYPIELGELISSRETFSVLVGIATSK